MPYDQSIDIYRYTSSVWDEVSSKVNKAVVFLDGSTAECLHWHGGATRLFNSGAQDVKEYSSFESGDEHQRKAVFILSSPLVGTTTAIMRDIVQGSRFHYVIVLTSLPAAMHTVVRYGLGGEEQKAFFQLEDELLEWMGDVNYTVELHYLPFVAAPIVPQLFVLPEHTHMFPLLSADLDILTQISLKSVQKDASSSKRGVEYVNLPKELQLRVKLLVCSLNSMLENLSVSEDLYALGHTSRVIASELAGLTWAKARRKSAQHKASLLLVDRSLDVVSVVGHHMETLVDRVLAVQPRLPGHHNDVCVNMAPVCTVTSNPNHSVILPGCLAHPNNEAACSTLHAMFTMKHKEGLMELNRQVVEAASRENLPLKLSGRPGRVTPEQLYTHAVLFKDKKGAVCKSSGLLQLALATVEALRQPASQHLDTLLGIEKGLLQCVGEEEEVAESHMALLAQLTATLTRDLHLPTNERLHSIEDMFLLLLYVYSLMEPVDEIEMMQKERKLQDALVQLILDTSSDKWPEFLNVLVGEDILKEKVVLIMQDIFEKFHSLSRARDGLEQFSCLFEGGGMTSQTNLQPLVKQVVEKILDPTKPELTDIVYKSTGLRDLLKSGFGLFMNVSKPRPSDHPLLIVFVVGGVTSTEVRQIRESVNAAKSSMQVVLGSTRLVTATDMLHSVLVQDNLHPQF